MAGSPHRLQPDTQLKDNLSLINDNFDKAVQDMSDLGSKFSTIGSTSFTLTPQQHANKPFVLVDADNSLGFQPGRVEIVPRIDLYVDLDDDPTSLFQGDFSTLTPEQNNLLWSVTPTIAQANIPGSLAQYIVQVLNRDIVDHTYFLKAQVSFQHSPRRSRFR